MKHNLSESRFETEVIISLKKNIWIYKYIIIYIKNSRLNI